MHIGESSVEATSSQFNEAKIEVVIGDIKGPAGIIYANAITKRPQYQVLLGMRSYNNLIKPSTVIVPMEEIDEGAVPHLWDGIVQSAISEAIIDAILQGYINRNEVNNLCIIVFAWLNAKCQRDIALNMPALFRNNYAATMEAIKRAMSGSPTFEEILKTRKQVKHHYHEESWDQILEFNLEAKGAK